MKQLFQVAAIGCFLPLIEAGGFIWNGNHARDVGEYIPAYETGIGRNIQTLAMGPQPTSPAQLKKGRSGILAERQTTDDRPASVCGYIEGSSEYPYACAVTDSCLLTTISGTWVAGCCPTTSLDCNIATTCIDSSVWETLTSIGDHTYSCTYSDYPYCLTMTYGDLVGYSIMNCAAEPETVFELIDYEPTTASSASSSDTITSIITSADNGGGTQTSTSTPASSSSSSSTATSTSTTGGKSSMPIGAIVGGAVGGIAVIALLILGLVFIMRRNKNKNHDAAQNTGMQPGPPPMAGAGPPPPPSGGYPPPQPAMDQQWQPPPPAFQPGFGAGDPHASVQKPPYDVKTTSVYAPTLSSPGSPPPQHQSPSPGYQSGPVSPPLQPSQGTVSPTEPVFQDSGVGPNQGFQQHHQHGSGSYYEMPAVRADGELRELA